MPEPPPAAVALQLAESGRDLEGALEAAQYGRFIQADEPGSEAEARAIGAFSDLFAAATEAWSESPRTARTATLARLGGHLEALERLGLFVHWAKVELVIEAASMPVAILTIGRSDAPTLHALLPAETRLAQDEPTRH